MITRFLFCFFLIHTSFYPILAMKFVPPASVRIGGMFPISSTVKGVIDFSGPQYLATSLMAIREINDKQDGIADNLLPNTKILFAAGAPRNLI